MRQASLGTALRAAFPHTIPVLAGFSFLGIAYGIYMSVAGFTVWYSLLISVAVFGGSLQFVAVSMLLSPFAPVQTLMVALMVQARHLFYGISMLEKYKGLGWKKPYLIFAMCDETFSINCTAEIPEGTDRGWFYFFVSALNQCYWVGGTLIGAVAGQMIAFNTEGLDFVMTAMFVVIFLEQWRKDQRHISAWVGLLSSVGCLMLFGPDRFLIPAMLCILSALTALRGPISEKAGDHP